MNMEEQIMPIVPFGKYKDKSVLDLLADANYVEWLKQQAWFPSQKQIYNIVVHQTIPTSNNAKTPEHNKLQNLFLNKSNQQKLLSKIYSIHLDVLKKLFADEDIIRCFDMRCFDINKIPVHNLDKTSIKFEDKFNWDMILYYNDNQSFRIISKLEIELIDKAKYKEQYDIKQQKKHDNNLLLFDRLIEAKIKLDEEEMNKYEEAMQKYSDKQEKYENDIKIYLQEKPQNEKDITNYENKLKTYENKRDKFITQKEEEICLEVGINYDNFVHWNLMPDKKDTKHTTQEKGQLLKIVNDKLNPFVKEFDRINEKPKFVEKLNIPTTPSLPNKPTLRYIQSQSGDIYELFEKCTKIFHMWNDNCSIKELTEHKKKYEASFKEHYDATFNQHYEKYREEYYRKLLNKYGGFYINKNKTQYDFTIDICNTRSAICCELKPTLSDDYPCVLRKLTTQIELTKNDKTTFETFHKKYILIIGNFTSANTSKDQLITIFKQSNIIIIFTDEIFESSKSHAIEYINTNTNTEQILFKNRLIEENKTLTDTLLKTQEKLLQAEEKIKQLEEEIQSLKAQKQSKSIKDYFGKK